MNKVLIDWSLFTAKEDSNFALSVPCVIDGFKYATDGRILIRVKTDEPDTEAHFPNPLRFEWGSQQEGKPFPLLRSPERQCEHCDGGGRETTPCNKCERDGVIKCGECGQFYDCKNCLGKGSVPTSVACKTCKGSGKIYFPENYENEDFRIAGYYGNLMVSLAGAKYYVPENKKEMLHFSFDGGEGFIMPILPPRESEVTDGCL